jgi:hypothetical protein
MRIGARAGHEHSLYFLDADAAAFEPRLSLSNWGKLELHFPSSDEGHMEGLRRFHNALQFCRIPRPDDVMLGPEVRSGVGDDLTEAMMRACGAVQMVLDAISHILVRFSMESSGPERVVAW